MANINGGENGETLNGDPNGTPENDTINGNGGDDTLNGLGGDDTLNGNAGSDQIYGGDGDDTGIVDGGTGAGDTPYEYAHLGAQGPNGDRLVLNFGALTEGLRVAQNRGLDGNGFYGQWFINGFHKGDYDAIEHLTVRSGSGNDHVEATSGNDDISLGAGDDFVDLRAGTDRAEGGTGTDAFSADMSAATSAIAINLRTYAYSGPAGTNITNFEYVGTLTTGSGNDDIVGTALPFTGQTFNTNGGDDRVEIHNGAADRDNGFVTVNLGAQSTGGDRLVLEFGSLTRDLRFLQNRGSDANGHNGQWFIEGFHKGNFDAVEHVTIRSGSGNDEIEGTSGNDDISTGAGDDLVDLRTGSDSADGGLGTDRLSADMSAATTGISINLRTYAYSGPAGTNITNFEYVGTLSTGSGTDDIVGTALPGTHQTFNTNGGDDRVEIHSAATDRNNGFVNVNLGGQSTGGDRLVLEFGSLTTDMRFLQNRGSDANGHYGQWFVEGFHKGDFNAVEHVTIRSGSGNDEIEGTSGNDDISTGAGNDSVDLRTGTDSADGGLGTDRLSADMSAATTGISINLRTYAYSGPAGTNITNFEYVGTLSTGSGNDDIVTTALPGTGQTINTNGGDDRVEIHNGAADRDNGFVTVSLGAQSTGGDRLVLEFGSLTRDLRFLQNRGSDVNGHYGQWFVEGFHKGDFNAVDHVTVTGGSGNDEIEGTSGNDILDGGSGGNDVLRGEAGDDILKVTVGSNPDYNDAHGGAGTDTLIADFSASTAVESSSIPFTTNAGGGHDGQYSNGSNHNVRFSSIERFIVTGSAFNDAIVTGEGGDRLMLHVGGDDTVSTGGGNDVIYFGAAYTVADTVNGGAGIDTVALQGNYTITLSASSLAGVEVLSLLSASNNRFGQATTGSHSYNITVPSGFSGGQVLTVNAKGLSANETLTFDGSAEATSGFGVYGGAGNDSITGGGGLDILDGGAGVDTLAGRGGNDFYFVDTGDTVTEAAGQGFDIVFARSSFVLGAGSEVEMISAADATLTTSIDLTGNELNNVISGNNGANRLTGGAGSDYLTGYLGNDVLDGGDGHDIMVGGGGDDDYYVESLDSVREAAGEGRDRVFARTSFELAAGVSVEVLAAADATSTAALVLVGNDVDNEITGNAGNNHLRGGGGADIISGLAGNDILEGGVGADSLIGGTGNDRYYVDTGDTITEAAGEGFDIAYTSTSYTLGAGVHVEMLLAADANAVLHINLTGNELNNVLQGNAGANVLTGGGGSDYLSGLAGQDYLDGGAGRDILVGGSGMDTFRFSDVAHSPLGGPDRISDFVSGTDKINLSLIDANTTTAGTNDAFTFIGTNAFSGTAGELRYEVQANGVHIYGDVDGNGVADLHIVASNIVAIAGTDFIL